MLQRHLFAFAQTSTLGGRLTPLRTRLCTDAFLGEDKTKDIKLYITLPAERYAGLAI